MRIVTFGELLLRLDAPGHERFVQARAFETRYTGAEANVAVALTEWGAQAFAVSRVPDHEIGQACLNELRRHGVNTDWVVRGGDRLGILFVEAGASQRPSNVIYDRGHSSFCTARRDDFDWDAILADKDWFHFSGTAPAMGPDLVVILQDALRTARRLRIPVSFDCNYRSKLWGREEARAVLPTLMQHVSVFTGSPHDALELFDITGTPTDRARALWERFGLRCVGLTLRRDESASVSWLAGLVCDTRGCHESREYEVHVVDRIGAGDAFAAGLIHGIASGWELERTSEFAAAASCLKHTIPGDFLLASVAEVEHLANTGEAGPVRR